VGADTKELNKINRRSL